jgi:hypothetical protein
MRRRKMSRYITLLVALSVATAAGAFAQDQAQAPAIASTDAIIIEFSMADHVHEYAEGEDCSLCHSSVSSTFVPPKEVCAKCHEQKFLDNVVYGGISSHGPVWALNHRQAAKGNAIDCMECHQQADCMDCHRAGLINDDVGGYGNGMINVHRSEFRVTHPIAARTDPRLCASCHETRFCNDCHNDFNPADLSLLSHRKGWSSIDVAGSEHGGFAPDSCDACHPGSVLPSHDWSAGHAREARKNLVTCQACHPEGDICLTCHSARGGLGVNPHPKDWGDIQNRLKNASGGKTCRKCH